MLRAAFGQTRSLAGADAEHDPVAALPDGLGGLDTLLPIGGVDDEVNPPATGQLGDFGGDVVGLVIENVVGAAPGQMRIRTKLNLMMNALVTPLKNEGPGNISRMNV